MIFSVLESINMGDLHVINQTFIIMSQLHCYAGQWQEAQSCTLREAVVFYAFINILYIPY